MSDPLQGNSAQKAAVIDSRVRGQGSVFSQRWDFEGCVGVRELDKILSSLTSLTPYRRTPQAGLRSLGSPLVLCCCLLSTVQAPFPQEGQVGGGKQTYHLGPRTLVPCFSEPLHGSGGGCGIFPQVPPYIHSLEVFWGGKKPPHTNSHAHTPTLTRHLSARPRLWPNTHMHHVTAIPPVTALSPTSVPFPPPPAP